MPTKPDKNDTSKTRPTLSQSQLSVIDLLSLGATITAAAEAIGVSRQTVSEWFNQSVGFQAALNHRRAELWAEQSDRLRGLLPKALDTVERTLKSEGPESLKAALAIIRVAKIELEPSWPVDVEEIETMEAERKSDLVLRRLSASYGFSDHDAQ